MENMLQEDSQSFDLPKSLHEFFCYVFTSNCHIDEASVTSEEMRTLEELDSLEVLENLKEVVLELLRFKRDHKTSDNAELIQKSEQFETLLQKSEAEVRNHIRIEHQLKLHIESSQNRIDELEKLNSQLSKKLEDGSSSGKHSDKDVDLKLKQIEQRFNNEMKKITNQHIDNKKETSEKIIKEYEQKIEQYAEDAEKKDKAIIRLKEECIKLKNKLEEKMVENERLKNEIERLRAGEKKTEPRNAVNIDYLKKKLEEKAADLNKMQQKIKERVNDKSPALANNKEIQHPSKDRSRSNRKSLGEVDIMKSNTIEARKENTESSPLRDSYKGSPVKKAKVVQKGHSRSRSDQIRPSTAPKRIGNH
ncbi:unnamed protein product [Blepharisma stoltei]|uniref:Uncharacterized protein n=1 Tax=Blepharisma stoltei TaxID=1481888 RepID=A0AAU9JDS3_9CILI|nr:unnamed protein product [Blepharisma stoltei]